MRDALSEELAQTINDLRKKRQEQEAKEIKEYRDRFWSEAQNTPTRPPYPLK
jgi:hypothetical protein